MLSVFAAALLLAAADPAPPAVTPPSASAPVAQAAAAPKAAKKVCWQETPTGSHFSKQVCVTQDEYDRAQRAAQDSVAEHGRGLPPPSLGPSR
ncbi:hypothetical protein [Phenylobacterium sp.]|uniref:hypothetical protein n=1 Tax=Phenylobacterium sp. TaxID=1871053 RepID=UPI0035645F07